MKRLLAISAFCILLFSFVLGQSPKPFSASEKAEIEEYVRLVGENEAKGDKNEASRYLNKLANLYWEHNYSDEALGYFSRSLKFNEALGNTHAVRSIYNFMGMIYADQGKYSQSIEMYEKALAMVRNSGRRDASLVEALKNLAFGYESMKNYPKAISNLEEAAGIAKEMNNLPLMRTCYFALADLNEKAGNKTRSTEYFNEFNRIDKILVKQEAEIKNAQADQKVQEISSSKRAVESQLAGTSRALVEADSLNQLRATQIQLLQREKEIADYKVKEQEMEVRNANLVRNSAIGGAILASALLIVSLYGFQQKRKDNKKLEEKNREITRQQNVIEKEKEKSDELLLNILPHSTAQELKDRGQATPRHYDRVSVMFTDFVGFTRIAEDMHPEQLVHELGRCFLAFDEVIERYNLEKIKTIGDSYMCAGGIPAPNETNPLDIVNAALDIRAFMQGWNTERKAKGEAPWELRIGIHTGSLVAGVIGKKKFAYDIWGDAVNTASRMESSGEPNRINVSGFTYDYIKNDFECTYRGKIQAKNKGEVDMYFVESKK